MTTPAKQGYTGGFNTGFAPPKTWWLPTARGLFSMDLKFPVGKYPSANTYPSLNKYPGA